MTKRPDRLKIIARQILLNGRAQLATEPATWHTPIGSNDDPALTHDEALAEVRRMQQDIRRHCRGNDAPFVERLELKRIVADLIKLEEKFLRELE